MTSIVISSLALTGAVGSLAGIFIAYKYIGLSERNERLEDDAIVVAKLLDATKEQRDGLQEQLDATSAQLRTERDLRAVAESQRNDALKQGVQHAVDHIKASGIADAARLGDELLASPLPALRSSAAANGGGQGTGLQPAPTPR